MSSKVATINILITGASRGIGRALVAALLQRSNNTVIAAVRNPSSSGEDLQSLPIGPGSQLIVTKIDSEIDSDAGTAVNQLTSQQRITHLDTVIANAGIGDYAGPAASTSATDLMRHFQVNAAAPLILFQATRSLLEKSSKPRFFTMSSNLASLGLMEHIPFPGSAYGASKAAANFLTRKIHFENEWLTAVVIGPGWVQTDMGAFAAKVAGVEGAPVTLEDSIKGVLHIVSSSYCFNFRRGVLIP